MATNLPFSGRFKITCEYGRKNSGSLKWAKGSHPRNRLSRDNF